MRQAMASPDPLRLVHPDLRPALAALTGRDPEPLLICGDIVTPNELYAMLPVLRRAWAADTSHVPALARRALVEHRWIAGATGAPDVGIYIVRPPGLERRPAILHMHGGGFIVGNALEYVPVLQAQALALDCVIVTVDYRLAPETRFPGALDDNYAALKWLYSQAGVLQIDPDRIAIQGESAGGGHAAMLALHARDLGEVPIAFQCLTYPMLDDRTGSQVLVPQHIGTYCWTPKYNRMGWTALLGVEAGAAIVPNGAVPARANDLDGLPPTFLWVGSMDLFAQENLAFAARLAAAGVPVQLHLSPGVYHGFDGAAPASAITIGYKLAMFRALAEALGCSLAPQALDLISPA